MERMQAHVFRINTSQPIYSIRTRKNSFPYYAQLERGHACACAQKRYIHIYYIYIYIYPSREPVHNHEPRAKALGNQSSKVTIVIIISEFEGMRMRYILRKQQFLSLMFIY